MSLPVPKKPEFLSIYKRIPCIIVKVWATATSYRSNKMLVVYLIEGVVLFFLSLRKLNGSMSLMIALEILSYGGIKALNQYRGAHVE